ncbi:MAG: RING finger protein [Candidatus Geothermincolia bacterium]
MGFYNIHELFENYDWRCRCRLHADELVVEGGTDMVCPICLRPFRRARLEGEGIVCPNCSGIFDPDR